MPETSNLPRGLLVLVNFNFPSFVACRLGMSYGRCVQSIVILIKCNETVPDGLQAYPGVPTAVDVVDMRWTCVYVIPP
jgi:hypothetical protein